MSEQGAGEGAVGEGAVGEGAVGEVEPLDSIKTVVSERAYKIFAAAKSHSEARLKECAGIVDEYLAANHLPAEQVCIVALGSVGRHEATDASDLDLIPILGTALERQTV